jgi:hypothetical protein
MDPLLLNEQVIALYPSLVRALGGHDLAAFVQQVHWRSQIGPERDGHRWAVATTAEWCDDVVLTIRQFKRVVGLLVEMGVIVRSAADGSIDRTAWTRIDHDRLTAVAKGPDALGRNRTDGRAETVPMSSVRNRPNELPIENTKDLSNTYPAAVEATASGRVASEAVACPSGPRSGGCGAAVGVSCCDRDGPGAQPKRYQGRSHTVRVAVALTKAWWDGVTERTGHSPAGVNYPGLCQIVRKMLDADWKHTAVSQALDGLHREGRTVTGQTLEARLRGAFPGQRLAVVTEARNYVARTANGEAPAMPEFGSNPIFDLSKPIPEGGRRAIGR